MRKIIYGFFRASLVAQMVENLPALFQTFVRKIPWRRKWKPTPVFLPGEFHGQKSQADYGAWSCKDSDPTKQLTHIPL